MPTWTRTFSATGAANGNVAGPHTLTNGTAPADFDPDGVTAVSCDHSAVGSGFSDDTFSWTNTWRLSDGTNTFSQGIGYGAIEGNSGNSWNVSADRAHTDINTGFSVAQWESAEMYLPAASYASSMKGDGGTITLSGTVTITYTPLVLSTLDSHHYEFLVPATAEDTVAEVTDDDGTTAVTFAMRVATNTDGTTVEEIATSAPDFEYRINGGAWATVTGTTSNPVHTDNSTTVSLGTGAFVTTAVGGGRTVIGGALYGQAGALTVLLDGNEETEVRLTCHVNTGTTPDLVAGDYIEFRIDPDGTGDWATTYTSGYPRVNIVASGPNSWTDTGATAVALTVTPSYAKENVAVNDLDETAPVFWLQTIGGDTEALAMTETGGTAPQITFTTSYGTEVQASAYDETDQTAAALTVSVSYVTEDRTHEERGGNSADLVLSTLYGSESASLEERGGAAPAVTFSVSYGQEFAQLEERGGTAPQVTFTTSYTTETFGYADLGATPAALTFTTSGVTEGVVMTETGQTAAPLTVSTAGVTESVAWSHVGETSADLTITVSYGTENFSGANNYDETNQTAAPLTVTPSYVSESQAHEERAGNLVSLTVTPSYATETRIHEERAGTAAPLTVTVSYGTENYSEGGTAYDETNQTAAALTVTVGYQTEGLAYADDVGATAAAVTFTTAGTTEGVAMSEVGGSVAPLTFTTGSGTEQADYDGTAGTAITLTVTPSGNDGAVYGDTNAGAVLLVLFASGASEFFIPAGGGGSSGDGQIDVRGDERFPRGDIEHAYRKRRRVYRSGSVPPP